MFNKISNHINSLLAFFASNFSKMFSRNSNKRKTPILKGLSILVVLLVTIFLFFKFNGFGPKSFSAYINDKFAVLGIGTNFPHDVIGTKIDKKNFSSMNNCLCYVSDSNFASMNSTNKNLINEKHNFSTPILKSSKNFSIVYNLYGTAARIFSKTKEVLEFNTEKNILCAAVSDCGTFGVVTEAKGYFCKLEAFKDLNREKKCFSYSFSDVYITEIAFADNGKSLAVVGVGSKDGTFFSRVYFFDLKTEKPIRQIEYSEKTVVGLNYFGSGAYAVVGEKFLGIVSFKKTFEYDYKNKYLICYRVSKRSGVLLALSDSESGNNSELIWLDSAGHEKANFKTKYCIKDVTFENNKIIALSLDKILKFTKSFKVIKEKEIPTNLIRVEHIGGKIYGVGQNKIVKLF